MNFLLDTDICSAFLKGNHKVWHRCIQHGGGLCVSSISVGELYSWVLRARSAPGRLQGLEDFPSDVAILPVSREVAHKFGEVRAGLLDRGQPTPTIDLFIASTALFHDLTLVTHNVKDFARVPDLRIEDWVG